MPNKTFKDYIDESIEDELPEIPENDSFGENIMEEASPIHLVEEQKHQKLYESIIQTNTQLLKATKVLIESSQKSNQQLAESVSSLSAQLKLLEEKIKEFRNIKVPAPIVNLTLPNSRIKKEVHRDDNGLITHITEEIIDHDDDNQED